MDRTSFISREGTVLYDLLRSVGPKGPCGSYARLLRASRGLHIYLGTGCKVDITFTFDCERSDVPRVLYGSQSGFYIHNVVEVHLVT